MLAALFRSRLLRAGLILLVVGTSPLVVTVGVLRLGGDPNPNPVLPGILAMLTFWPAALLIVAGFVQGTVAYVKEKRRSGQ